MEAILKTITKRRLTQINDDLWSLIVRTRDKYICQMCKKTKIAKPNKYNDAHHIIGRDNKAVRWDIDNGITFCFYHHKNWLNKVGEEDKIKFYESVTDYDELKLRANRVVKFNLEFCKSEFVRLINYCVDENINTSKIVPRYIVKELLSEGFPIKERKND